ncbi:MAG: hypothetical protein VW271_00330 [Chloroflexota bacterium]
MVEHRGADALDLLHRLTTKSLIDLEIGKSERTILTSNRGRVVDAFDVARVDDEVLILVSDQHSAAPLIDAVDYYTIIEDAELRDLSNEHSRISLVGPEAPIVASRISEELPDVFVIDDSSKPVAWFELIFTDADKPKVISILEKSEAMSIDVDDYAQFRIEHKIPAVGHELGEHSNPIEAGALDRIDFDKGCYVGQEVIARLDAYDKVQRNLIQLQSSSRIDDFTDVTDGDRTVGVVTTSSSVTQQDGAYKSLALVRLAYVESGTKLQSGDTELTVL